MNKNAWWEMFTCPAAMVLLVSNDKWVFEYAVQADIHYQYCCLKGRAFPAVYNPTQMEAEPT